VYGPELGNPAALLTASKAFMSRILSGDAGSENALPPQIEYVLEWHKSRHGIMPPNALHLAIVQGTGEAREKKRGAAAKILKSLRLSVGAFDVSIYETSDVHKQAEVACIKMFCETAIDRLAEALSANMDAVEFVQSTGGVRNASLQTRARSHLVRCLAYEKQWRAAAVAGGIRLAGVSGEARCESYSDAQLKGILEGLGGGGEVVSDSFLSSYSKALAEHERCKEEIELVKPREAIRSLRCYDSRIAIIQSEIDVSTASRAEAADALQLQPQPSAAERIRLARALSTLDGRIHLLAIELARHQKVRDEAAHLWSLAATVARRAGFPPWRCPPLLPSALGAANSAASVLDELDIEVDEEDEDAALGVEDEEVEDEGSDEHED
jgi:hypothetical protein